MKYERSIIIGRSAMADVFRGRQQTSSQMVAMKGLKDQYCTPAIVAIFDKQGKIGLQLQHPNIVRVHDIIRDQERPYIVMDFLEGETLRSRLQGQTLSKTEAVDIARQALQGLTQAHRQGVAHLALKPSNIFLGDHDEVSLVDFGLAAVAAQIEHDFVGVHLRSPQYLSPEQLHDQNGDARSDVYAMGVILYEMLAGFVPFKGETIHEVIEARENPLPPLSHRISPSVRALVSKAMNTDPVARFGSAGEMLAALQNPTWRDPDAAVDALDAASLPRTPDALARRAWATTVANEIASDEARPTLDLTKNVPREEEKHAASSTPWIIGGIGLLAIIGLAFAAFRPSAKPENVVKPPVAVATPRKKATPKAVVAPVSTPKPATPKPATPKPATPSPAIPKPAARPISTPELVIKNPSANAGVPARRVVRTRRRQVVETPRRARVVRRREIRRAPRRAANRPARSRPAQKRALPF